jgi:hypothetical protein
VRTTTTRSTTTGRADIRARAVLAGMAGFAGASLVAGTLEPGYDPLGEMISTLAAQDARVPALMIAGFLTAAGALLVAGVTLVGRLSGVAGRIGAVLVALAGIGMIVAGLARQDCSLASQACLARESAGLLSSAHWLHQFSSLALFIALVIAAPLLARGVRRTPRLHHLARPMRWIALAGLISLIVLISQSEGDYAGAAQRAFLAVVFGWPVWLTYATAPVGTRPGAPAAVAKAPAAVSGTSTPTSGARALVSGTQASFSAR